MESEFNFHLIVKPFFYHDPCINIRNFLKKCRIYADDKLTSVFELFLHYPRDVYSSTDVLLINTDPRNHGKGFLRE